MLNLSKKSFSSIIGIVIFKAIYFEIHRKHDT